VSRQRFQSTVNDNLTCRVPERASRVLLHKQLIDNFIHKLYYNAVPKYIKEKGKAIPVTGHGGPKRCGTSRLPRFLDNQPTDGGEVVSLTRRPPFTPSKIPSTHFCKRLSRTQGHSATGRIRSIEKSNGLIGNRTRDIPTCSIVPQPTKNIQKQSDVFKCNRDEVCANFGQFITGNIAIYAWHLQFEVFRSAGWLFFGGWVGLKPP
jgi:hypothetical protein